MTLAAHTSHFSSLSGTKCCCAFTIVTQGSTNTGKPNRNLLLVRDLSQCQPAGGWRTFLWCSACCVLLPEDVSAVSLQAFWMYLTPMGSKSVKTAVTGGGCSFQNE